MLRAFFLLLSIGFLSSCYTNFNQRWFFSKHREYVGYEMDYYADVEGGIQGLPPVLYKHGNDWYIAAVRHEIAEGANASAVHHLGDDLAVRNDFVFYPESIYFHKITPELAYWLRMSDQESHLWFTEHSLRRELRKAGGGWVPSLPAGTVKVDAAYLKYAKRSLMLVDQVRNDAPWYAYPAAGLTFLCVDLPASTVMIACDPRTILTLGLALASAKMDGEAGDDCGSSDDGKRHSSKKSGGKHGGSKHSGGKHGGGRPSSGSHHAGHHSSHHGSHHGASHHSSHSSGSHGSSTHSSSHHSSHSSSSSSSDDKHNSSSHSRH